MTDRKYEARGAIVYRVRYVPRDSSFVGKQPMREQLTEIARCISDEVASDIAEALASREEK